MDEKPQYPKTAKEEFDEAFEELREAIYAIVKPFIEPVVSGLDKFLRRIFKKP